MNKTIKFKEHELTLNWMNAKKRKQIVEACEIAGEKLSQVDESDAIKSLEITEAVYQETYDAIFGPGTSEKIFDENTSIDDYFELLDLILQAKEVQENEATDAVKTYSEKFKAMADVK